MREVYINKQRVDITDKSTEGYIFNSPIFRDFEKINGNRTATYKLPKTNRNLRIIGLSNNPDVESSFPYEKHRLSEYRDGLPFIVDAECQLLSCKGNDLEFSVTWGNITKIKELKGVKLRDLEKENEDQWLLWNNNIKFLSASDIESNKGYLYIDFGQEAGNKEYTHPCVSISHLLNLIKERRGISFKYPDQFEEMFKKTWIPLLEKNAGQPNWDDYTVKGGVHGWYDSFRIWNVLKLEPLGYDPYRIIINNAVRWDKPCKVVIKYTIKFYDNNPEIIGNKFKDAGVGIVYPKGILSYGLIHDRVKAYGAGIYEYTFETEYEYTRPDDRYSMFICPFLCYLDEAGNQSKFNNPVVESIDFTATIKKEKIEFGIDKFPIIPNLPDLSVIDFIKSLMQMFGVFTYITPEKDIVNFISIDDMYKNKDKAQDWTNKLIKNSEGKYVTNYLIDGYAQNNHLRYSDKDKDVVTKADGTLLVNNINLEEEKDLFMLPYSASDNNKDATGNEYAFIPIYTKEGNEVQYNKLNHRVLFEGEYKISDTKNDKSGYFAPLLMFNGEKGLISKYYSKYLQVVQQPKAVQCNVKLSDIAMSDFDPQIPVYIEGTYYMPIKVTMQTDGKATCQLIKMP